MEWLLYKLYTLHKTEWKVIFWKACSFCASRII